MARLRTITTQFIDGEPSGIRIFRRKLSTVTTVLVPRPLLARAKNLPELPTYGIYYLIDDEDGVLSRIYIGQTTQGLGRLDDHKAKKKFWNKAVLFLADSSVFTLDVISGLEKYAIERAQRAQRYTVENKINPRYRIDHYEFSTIEEVYEEIEFLMASLGYSLESTQKSLAADQVLTTSRRGIVAKGVYAGTEFEVLSGSPVDIKVEPKLSKYSEMRLELIAKGDIEIDGEGLGMLSKTIAFTSPSGAADFVLGGSNNGWIEWKDEDGKTLDELYRQG